MFYVIEMSQVLENVDMLIYITISDSKSKLIQPIFAKFSAKF